MSSLASPVRLQPVRPLADRAKPPSRTRPSQNRHSISSLTESHSESPQSLDKHATHQRFVLTDPVAFRYLEEDPSTQVLARREKLEGYECYLVEQWACSRTHPTFIITTYTGDPSHNIVVSVLSVPMNEESWSPRLKVYFKALSQYHARRRETPLGTLMITNLSGFPSSLTVIPIPEGDARNHREDFFVNENLKRLGCSGRVGLTLGKPSDATKAKFYQLYRASDKIPFNSAVIELVKLCQMALMLFGKLEPEYADGLLCDVTEKAINDWWIEFGTEYYNIEPHDGILGPTTVAALLGMLIGARNRLNAYGAQVSKDVFDIETTKRAIASFQRSQRIPKTRRLDRQTLSRLRRATAKAASGEGWIGVPRAVKSTVAELSGKGGEMVMDMVAGRDRAGIAEVETADIDQFIHLIHGARSKWLWQGKPRKHESGDTFSKLSGRDAIVFQQTDEGGFEWSSRRKGAFLEPSPPLRESAGSEPAAEMREYDVDKDRNRLMKKFSERESSTRTHESSRGLGRLKDAVGLRGHASKHMKEPKSEQGSRNVSGESEQPTSGPQPPKILPERADVMSPESEGHFPHDPTLTKTLTESPTKVEPVFFEHVEPPSDNERPASPQMDPPSDSFPSRSPTVSVAGSTYGGDLDEVFKGIEPPDHNLPALLRRNQSYSQYQKTLYEPHSDARFPRHLSFSTAEESVLTWDTINEPVDFTRADLLSKTKATLEIMTTEDIKRLAQKLSSLETYDSAWVTREIANISALNEQADMDQQDLDHMYYPRLEEHHILQEDSRQLLDQERGQLSEALKEIEQLGAKLEYEINALRGKVEDVEDGVAEFERQVLTAEDRVGELEYDMRPKEGWVHWIVRMTTGLGKRPAAAAGNSAGGGGRRARSR